jgi:NTE family protein
MNERRRRPARRSASLPQQPRRLALVLGGGGARGLAHIPVLEALDEMGIRPVAIAGSSIGAAIGAAYAAGMSGKEIRRHAIALLHDRPEVLRRLVNARAAAITQLFSIGFGNPMVMNAEKLAELFLPAQVPETFEQLGAKLFVMTTDFYGRSEMVLAHGRLRPALAATMAIPGLIRPVEIGGRVLIDGAAVNPLPFQCLRAEADIILAVDTSVGPTEPRGIPDPWEALFTAIQIMGHTIVAEKLKADAPDIVIRPQVGTFRLLDFFKASAILRVADTVKPEVTAKLAVLLKG